MTLPFSSELESVIREARDLAKATRRQLSSAHLLLALFTAPNQAQQYLREHAVDETTLLARLDKLVDDPPDLLDLVLARAARVAEGTRADTVTSLHLLAALSAFKDGGAYRLMSQAGLDMGDVRIKAMSFLLNDEVPLRFKVKAGDVPRVPDTAAESARREPAAIGFHPGLAAVGGRAPSPVPVPARRPPPPKPAPKPAPAPPAGTPGQHDLARRLFSARSQQPPKTEAKPRPSKPSPARPALAIAAAGAAAATVRAPAPDAAFALDPEQFPTLTRFGRNLSAEAALGRIDPVIGRDREIAQLVDILNKRRANNPVLVGAPGVGKTAVVEGLARLIASHEVPPGLENRVLLELEAGRIFGGTGLRGSLAERLVALRDEVERASGRVIVFLDEIHRWIGPAGGDQAGDGVEELKPALARGAFPCIGATTWEEYRRTIESDSAYARRFQIVRVEEPTIEQTVAILQGVAEAYAAHHGLPLTPEALRAAARLSHRYLPERHNPDKAVAVLDLAGSKARRLAASEVTEAIVAEVVAEMSGIPAQKLLMSERERFLQMEDALMAQVVGHERNLARIAHVLRRNYAGFVTGRPIGSFLFLGPTGVGKTETAKVLAEFLFHSREALTVLDMSELAEAHSVARLIGAPPGYVGHDSGGQLTEAVRRQGYQIVLFDEIEKAHPKVHHLLLQILEEGRLTDSQGRVADFSNTVVVLTSNLGADEAFAKGASVGFARDEGGASATQDRVMEAARKALAPELWNRIDEPLVFEGLTRPQVERIAHLQLQRSSRRLLDEKGIAYTASPAVIDFLLDNGGWDPKLGARPMRRALERCVEAPIANLILSGTVQAPAEIQVEVEAGELVFEVR